MNFISLNNDTVLVNLDLAVNIAKYAGPERGGIVVTFKDGQEQVIEYDSYDDAVNDWDLIREKLSGKS